MISNKFRKLVMATLSDQSFKTQYGIKGIYYNIAADDALYPHIVVDIISVNTGDLSRKDFVLDVDVWTKGDEYNMLEICDTIESKFRTKNMPQTDFWPTFFSEAQRFIEDNDKDIKHGQIEFSVQIYE